MAINTSVIKSQKTHIMIIEENDETVQSLLALIQKSAHGCEFDGTGKQEVSIIKVNGVTNCSKFQSNRTSLFL